jgi:thioredoxin reductase (NADPH)
VIIHRRTGFRAAQIVVDQARQNPKIKFELNNVIEEIFGSDKLEGVKIRNVISGEVREIRAEGVFVYVGTQPNASFIGPELKRSEQGYLKTDAGLQTNIPGVFAAGDIRDTLLRQVATAVGDGALAAVQAEKYISLNNQ